MRERLAVARVQCVPDVLVEAHVPVHGRAGAQVMRPRLCTMLPLPSTSTPSSRSGASSRREFPVPVGFSRAVDGELHDGYVGVGVHVGEHRPGPVVEPPRLVEPDHFGAEQLRDLRRELRVAGRRVFHREELGREAGEVVDGAGLGHRGDAHAACVPVSGRPRGPRAGGGVPAELVPRIGVRVVFEGVHRVAVPEEHGGHRVIGCCFLCRSAAGHAGDQHGQAAGERAHLHHDLVAVGRVPRAVERTRRGVAVAELPTCRRHVRLCEHLLHGVGSRHVRGVGLVVVLPHGEQVLRVRLRIVGDHRVRDRGGGRRHGAGRRRARGGGRRSGRRGGGGVGRLRVAVVAGHQHHDQHDGEHDHQSTEHPQPGLQLQSFHESGTLGSCR